MNESTIAPCPLRILFVEDSADDACLIEAALRRAGLAFEATRVETEHEFLSALSACPDVLLCDFHLPRFDARRALELAGARCPGMPVLVVSHHIDAQESVEVLRLGAREVISKGEMGRIAPAIGQALQRRAG